MNRIGKIKHNVSMIKDQNKRSSCPVSCALDILGDKWTLLVIRDILFKGKQHFRDFLASPEKIASNILSDRLKKLGSAISFHGSAILLMQEGSFIRSRKKERICPRLFMRSYTGAPSMPPRAISSHARPSIPAECPKPDWSGSAGASSGKLSEAYSNACIE
jgi:hypothetical protein